MNFELPGVLFVLAGNMLLLMKGYDNRVELGRYNADTSWEKVSQEKFEELRELDRKMKKWDLDAIDISNALGMFLFILVAGVIGIGVWFGLTRYYTTLRILSINAAVLILPHWITGIRSILTRPDLILKMSMIESVVTKSAQFINNATVEYFMLLSGKKETKLPNDVKFRVTFNGQDPDFLGYYGQVVINKVKGHSYPYFYVVLVAKKGYGLKKYSDAFTVQNNLVKEFDLQEEVEVLVLRQKTTKTSGYHTSKGAAAGIFSQGLRLAEQASRKN
jgi:hypothetical protein